MPEVFFENRAAYQEAVVALRNIGVLDNHDQRKLYQSCHVIQLGEPNTPRFFIAHYKMLFMLDGRETPNSLSPADVGRLNYVVSFLCSRGIARVDYDYAATEMVARNEIKVIAPDDETYQRKQKYNLRTRKW